MSTTLITSRDPKGLHAVGIFEAAYNKAHLDDERAQRLNENGGELSAGLKELIERLSLSNQYADEERPSNYGYLSGYVKPVSIADQIDILRGHWPTLNPDAAIRYATEVYPTLQLPEWVEGPFALIRPKFFSEVYGEELEEVIKALKKARRGKVVNYREGELDDQHLRQAVRTTTMFERIMEQQPGSDILVVGHQFGIRHRGRSVRRAREVFIGQEFGGTGKNVGTMLLTNPIRLQHLDDLWIDCAGDEFSYDADGVFGEAPYWGFSDGPLRLGSVDVGFADGSSGTVSGVCPQ